MRVLRQLGILAAILPALALLAAGQTGAPMVAKLEAGQNPRYEFEGRFRVVTGHPDNVKLDFPADCSYNLSAVLKVEVEKANNDGRAGMIHFDGIRLSGFACGSTPDALMQALEKLQANGVRFKLGPDGEARLEPLDYRGPQYEGALLLLKSAWDLLQTRLGDVRPTPSQEWVSNRSFLYWPDTFEDGLDVAAASMQYTRDVTLEGSPYALLKYKQVFAPAEVPAYIQVRTDARDFQGTTLIAGKNSVDLLFDRSHQRVVYLRRERKIDNRTILKYDEQSNLYPVAQSDVVEASVLRWLPEQNSEAWLAELHNFENMPEAGEAEVAANAAAGEASVAELAEAARRRKAYAPQNVETEEVALTHRPPKGFQRWSRTECYGMVCFEVSLAVPEGARQAQTTSTTALLLSGSADRTITIGVGPTLDRQYSGLTDQELLQKQASIFLANYLWTAGDDVKKLNFDNSTLDDRPAALVDFTAKSRDLSPVRGRLVMVLSSYNRLVPVSCTYPAPQRADLDALCDTVTSSLLTR